MVLSSLLKLELTKPLFNLLAIKKVLQIAKPFLKYLN
jgi:hypothetical protein